MSESGIADRTPELNLAGTATRLWPTNTRGWAAPAGKTTKMSAPRPASTLSSFCVVLTTRLVFVGSPCVKFVGILFCRRMSPVWLGGFASTSKRAGGSKGCLVCMALLLDSLAGGVVLDQFQSHSEASMEERSVAELSHGCEKARNRQRTGVDAPAIKGGEQGPAGASARANCRAGHDSG